jgi:hypothetical protein
VTRREIKAAAKRTRSLMANILGYAASCAVLATFLMRTMVPLRLIAILSNILFLAFGYIQHIYPVLFLHVALLPINVWRLCAVSDAARGQDPFKLPRVGSGVALRNHALWFAGGLLAGLIVLLVYRIVENSLHV